MNYLVSSFAFLGLLGCGSSSSQAVAPTRAEPRATAPPAANDTQSQSTDILPGPLPSHSPLVLNDRSDFSQWGLPTGDIVGNQKKYWSASISEDDKWKLSFAKVTHLEQGQITIKGVERDGIQTEEYSHTAFLASGVQGSDYQQGTAVRFNRRYTYWGRILQIQGDAAQVQYVANGKLASKELDLDGLLPIHTTLDKLGTPVVWRAEGGTTWFGGTAIYAAKTGVYVITESQQLLFLQAKDLHINMQEEHSVGDEVLVKAKNSQHWQPATVDKAFETHIAYVVRSEDGETQVLDWAHIIALPPSN